MSKRGPKAPMVPMPIIGEPFERIAMDVIGPLPRTSTGKRFVLVITDYATRYPEAYAMSSVTAPAVTEKMIDMFSRYGVPREILSDQGPNFMAELLKEVYAANWSQTYPHKSISLTNRWVSGEIQSDIKSNASKGTTN